jgi:4-alpha-glucanotransferase
MAHAGGVRIDHVLGLRRIWVVPHGRPSAEGCYLAMPQADLLRIMALESWRHRALVVGEDLGTVPEGLRDELEAAGVDGMRVLWFERDEDGAFTDPQGWDKAAAAMTSTHDLPTLAGWWQARDIDWAWGLGRKSRHSSEDEERRDRQSERLLLWERLLASGHANGPCPPDWDTYPFVTAACAHVAASACELALIPLEDLFALLEQPNLPGTTDQHPNWRRRLPDTVEAMLARPDVAARTRAINAGRTQ